MRKLRVGDHRAPHGFRLHPDGKNLSVSGRLAIRGARIPVSATVALGVSARRGRPAPAVRRAVIARPVVPGPGGASETSS